MEIKAKKKTDRVSHHSRETNRHTGANLHTGRKSPQRSKSSHMGRSLPPPPKYPYCVCVWGGGLKGRVATFVTLHLISWTTKPFQNKVSYRKECPFPLRLSPSLNEKGGKIENEKKTKTVASPESTSVHLIHRSICSSLKTQSSSVFAAF